MDVLMGLLERDRKFETIERDSVEVIISAMRYMGLKDIRTVAGEG